MPSYFNHDGTTEARTHSPRKDSISDLALWRHGRDKTTNTQPPEKHGIIIVILKPFMGSERDPIKDNQGSQQTLRQTCLQHGYVESAICVRHVSVSGALQFAVFHAVCCVLHRPASRVIHCSEL